MNEYDEREKNSIFYGKPDFAQPEVTIDEEEFNRTQNEIEKGLLSPGVAKYQISESLPAREELEYRDITAEDTSGVVPKNTLYTTDCLTAKSSLESLSEESAFTTLTQESVAHASFYPQTNETKKEGVSPFYKETVKNDFSRLQKTRFKRMIALVSIASILGGSFLGIGLSVGSALLKTFFPYTSASTDRVNEVIEGNIFTEEAQPMVEGKVAEASGNEAVSVFSGDADSEYFSYASVINLVEPSVVCITSTMNYNGMFQQQGSGSGILFYESDTKYYIATNYHVISNATAINVSICGSEPIPAKVVGYDANNDLSVIYLNKKDIERAKVTGVVLAKFGDSDDMQVGDVVLAIGNALGGGNIATNGIISAKDKAVAISASLSLTMLQTNAAINPGNSGGPLVNLKGEVIGINTAKISETNTEGMGYSIPSNIAKPIIQTFMDSINKPYLGVRIEAISEEFAQNFNLPSAGAFVESVVEDSPADKAGIVRSDIITGFNGEPIITFEQLTEAVSKCNIGDIVEVKLIRDGKETITLKIKLEQRL